MTMNPKKQKHIKPSSDNSQRQREDHCHKDSVVVDEEKGDTTTHDGDGEQSIIGKNCLGEAPTFIIDDDEEDDGFNIRLEDNTKNFTKVANDKDTSSPSKSSSFWTCLWKMMIYAFVPVGAMVSMILFYTTTKTNQTIQDRPFLNQPPFGLCEGFCQTDDDCYDGLYCYERQESDDVIPGCTVGEDDMNSATTANSYCVLVNRTYLPGLLNVQKLGLQLSQGLDVRVVARTDELVRYADGNYSKIPFHKNPDAGATFGNQRDHYHPTVGALNSSRIDDGIGWVYVSNSEVQADLGGGVGGIVFDNDGNTIEYKRLLDNTSLNCGGGRTSWNTWISCEEHHSDRTGHVYQVDPFGVRPATKIVLGDEGGSWESFAYDDRDPKNPHFYVTEDHKEGALARYTPSRNYMNSTNNTDNVDPWNVLLDSNGTKDYLELKRDLPFFPNKGTFTWTRNKQRAQRNAEMHYPNTEGIDRHGSQLYFICKRIKMMYVLDLDDGAFERFSTVSGLFDSEPDQVVRLLENHIRHNDSTHNYVSPNPSLDEAPEQDGLLYFTEDGSDHAGVHARDNDAKFYTIMQASSQWRGETTGLAFSPDGQFMYIAYQRDGILFSIWRLDGKPFNGEHIDVKYHD